MILAKQLQQILTIVETVRKILLKTLIRGWWNLFPEAWFTFSA